MPMNSSDLYNVKALDIFKQQTKFLIKKYPSLKQELTDLVNYLKTEPFQGPPLGKDCYKIRLAIKSKGKGKSGGARVISYIQVSAITVYLLNIYDKSEKKSLSEGELQLLLNKVPQ